jgi:hypothetical protein
MNRIIGNNMNCSDTEGEEDTVRPSLSLWRLCGSSRTFQEGGDSQLPWLHVEE